MSKRCDFGTMEIHPDYLEIIEGNVGKTLFLKLRSKNQAGTVLEWICDRDNPPKCITDVTKMSDADIAGRHIVDGMCPYGYRNNTNKKSTIFWGRRGTIRMSNGRQL